MNTLRPHMAHELAFLNHELPKEARQALEAGTTSRVLFRDQPLYRAGDAPTGLHFIRRGLLGLVTTGATGHEYLIRLSKAGEFCGHASLFAGEPHHATAIALQDSEILTVANAVVLRVIKGYPQVAFLYLQALAKQFKRAELARVSMADKDVGSRVAETVLYLVERFPDYQWTRREIAEYCGSTTPTVIRTLAKLESEGLIRQKGRSIQILDRPGLLQLAELE